MFSSPFHLALHSNDGQEAREFILPREFCSHEVYLFAEHLTFAARATDDREAGLPEEFPDFMLEPAAF